MAEFEIEVQGLKETEEKLRQIMGDLAGPPMARAMGDVTLKVTRDARINAPVDTGRLESSIVPEVRATPIEIMGVVGSNVEYAPHVELGTEPHPIRATKAKALRFFWEDGPEGAKIYFFRSVWHPGTAPRRFLQKAFEKNQDYIKRMIGEAVATIVRK